MKRRLFSILSVVSLLVFVVQSCRRSTPVPRGNRATGPQDASDHPTKEGA